VRADYISFELKQWFTTTLNDNQTAVTMYHPQTVSKFNQSR